jgi:predicted GNAT superfamily acetyltransferase
VTAPPDHRVSIRELDGEAELRRCVRMQHEVWGENFGEVVPVAILWVATRTGGVVAGAFDETDSMVGLLVGLAGWRAGTPLHWSDMLAVLPSARGSGIGRRLKAFQRSLLLGRGVNDVFWTFDPLESRNAHLNFAKLGVTAGEYLRDCYSDSRSHLHEGLATDRLVAHWRLASPRVRSRMEGEPPAVNAHGLAAIPVVNDGREVREDLTDRQVRIRIPADIQALKARDPEAAGRWREVTRRAFEAYLCRGYEVTKLVRGTPEESSYVLELGTQDS